MALPNPIPDNPLRWEGWRQYNSPNYYERLCLDFESNPAPEQIEDHCRQLLVWWQKKLPLKNQLSNPLTQMLRAGLDEAPVYLVEARTILLDVEARQKHDTELRNKVIGEALAEFGKLISFSITDGELSPENEERLVDAGRNFGLTREEATVAIERELERVGGVRKKAVATPQPAPASAPAAPSAPVVEGGAAKSPADEFRRVLRLSRLCQDGEEMTDDQRDALCNMGESLGLTGGQAEDLIDEYLEEMEQAALRAISKPGGAPRPNIVATAAPAPPVRPLPRAPTNAPPPSSVRTAAQAAKAAEVRERQFNVTPAARALERQRFPNFKSKVGLEMNLVTSGSFNMGSAARDASPNEQPITPVSISCFYMSRFPVTNAVYEMFDPSHRNKRLPSADGQHPVIFVSAREAERFCAWLSRLEGRKYRLPTEAEWEYAARGVDNRIFPWGDRFDSQNLANFADRRTNFSWRDPNFDDGFAETSPVGSYPRGASPFGIEDMAGNVFEWCLDGFSPYTGKERVNPRGAQENRQRIYRGGSWKSRPTSLRATARFFNSPDFSSNDVGFRVVCECEPTA